MQAWLSVSVGCVSLPEVPSEPLPFSSLHIAGGLLPSDLVDKVSKGRDFPGQNPDGYGLPAHVTVGEAAQRQFDYLSGAWKAFSRDRDKAVSQGRPVAGLTRERWLLPLLSALDYGIVPAAPAGGLVVDDKAFKVNHIWRHVPIHLLGWSVNLDRRTKGVAGAASSAPHSMVQELLNRTDQHLWAMLSNGVKLRLLRDSRALAGSAFVEFDLELVFDQQILSEFVLLYRFVHASSFAIEPDQAPATCRLENWRTTSIEKGEKARGRLRIGVQQAINTLGTAFPRHPANDRLRERLASGTLALNDYKRALLRQMYRLLLWFVAEERGLLLDPHAPVSARERYGRFFSAERLRSRARRASADHHDDLWEAVRLVFIALGAEHGEPRLALPGIGGITERVTRDEHGDPIEPSLPDKLDEPLEGLRLTNDLLLSAIHEVAFLESGDLRRHVDFAAVESEELGSIYESLLELRPEYDPATLTFTLVTAQGNERKTTGSYSTPRPLVDALLDTALDPLIDEAARTPGGSESKVDALLKLTVCDPACGSGVFLVAAARRIARRIAEIRSGEEEPAPIVVYRAMRQVVSRCVYGVDVNELVVELAKLSLWLEPVEPARPLAFLDASIRVGNSLLGATPRLFEQGIPKDAFKPIEGDDKRVANAIAKDNTIERSGQQALLGVSDLSNATVAISTDEIVRTLPAAMDEIYEQRARLRRADDERLPATRIADAWCAAFVQPKTINTRRLAITAGTLSWMAHKPNDPALRPITDKVMRLAVQFQFFHWHLEFPHILVVPEDGQGVDPTTGWSGGFTCIVSNPPWERVKLQEQEFFATRRPEIAGAKNAAARKKLIAALETSDNPVDRKLFDDYRTRLRQANSWSHFLRTCGRYPLTGRGDINTYAVFAETARMLLKPSGRAGMILPTGIATDATTQYFFKDLVTTRTLASLYDFENEDRVFSSVHHSFRFCLWTGSGRASVQNRIHLAFRLRQTTQIRDRRFTLTPEDITVLNPNTGTCPVFDYRRNAEITLAIYRHVQTVLWREKPEHNPWSVSFMAMLHMANDSGLFRDQETLKADGWILDRNVFVRGNERMLPLYEAKMVHQFDHRLGTYDGQTQAQANVGTLPRLTPQQKAEPAFTVLPRYWVSESEVESRLASKEWTQRWFLGWRNIARSSDVRTLVPGLVPVCGMGHSFPLVLARCHPITPLYANLSSFVLDYVGRQKMAGTNYTFNYFMQLAILSPSAYQNTCAWGSQTGLADWITYRVLELSYTAYDMEGFARDHGDEGAPFRWDEERRFWLRAELDAAYFHLYGVPTEDVDYIMDTFRAFRNKDPESFTRTKTAILDIYDAMAKATKSGEPYRTVLDPPPGKGPRHPAGKQLRVEDHG